jgi:hypothetical protein
MEGIKIGSDRQEMKNSGGRVVAEGQREEEQKRGANIHTEEVVKDWLNMQSRDRFHELDVVVFLGLKLIR